MPNIVVLNQEGKELREINLNPCLLYTSRCV